MDVNKLKSNKQIYGKKDIDQFEYFEDLECYLDSEKDLKQTKKNDVIHTVDSYSKLEIMSRDDKKLTKKASLKKLIQSEKNVKELRRKIEAKNREIQRFEYLQKVELEREQREEDDVKKDQEERERLEREEKERLA